MTPPGNTTPVTEMLGLYRRLSTIGSRHLTAHLALAESFARRPDQLSARFALSVAQFSRYRNVDQPFHDKGPYAALPVSPPGTISRTIDFAAQLSARRRWSVAEHPELAFGYVDREPDCMRTNPGQPLEDGTPSKKAIVADLLLRDSNDGTPIVAELKIKADEDAFYGLIQALAAAAHLVTASQRLRLHNVYGYPLGTTGGPYLDVYVILFQHPMKGTRLAILDRAKEIRYALLETGSVNTLVRRIEFLHCDLVEGSIRFEAA